MKAKILTLALCLMICGCSALQTPEQRRYNTKVTFLGTLKTINILKEAGRFDEKEIQQIRVFANSADKIIKQWEIDGTITPDVMKALVAVLEELAFYELEGRNNE